MYLNNLEDFRDRFRLHAARLNQSFIALVALLSFFMAISGFFLDYYRIYKKEALYRATKISISNYGTPEEQKPFQDELEQLQEDIEAIKNKELSVSLLGTSLPSKTSLAGVMFSILSLLWVVFSRSERRRTRALIGGYHTAALSAGQGGASIGECPFWLAPIRYVEMHPHLNPHGAATVKNVLDTIGWSEEEHRNYSYMMGAISALIVLALAVTSAITYMTTSTLALDLELTTQWLRFVGVFVTVSTTLFVGSLLYLDFFSRADSTPIIAKRRQIIASLGIAGFLVIARPIYDQSIPRITNFQAKDWRADKKPRFVSEQKKIVRARSRSENRAKAISDAKSRASQPERVMEISSLDAVQVETLALELWQDGNARQDYQMKDLAIRLLRSHIDTSSDLFGKSKRIICLYAGLSLRAGKIDNLRALDAKLGKRQFLGEAPNQSPARKQLIVASEDWRPGSKWSGRWQSQKYWHHPIKLASPDKTCRNETRSGCPLVQNKINLQLY